MLNSNYLIILGMCLVTLVIMLLILPGLIDYLHKISLDKQKEKRGWQAIKRRMVRLLWVD